MLFLQSLCMLTAASVVSAKLTWGTTKYLFTFGDSYTTDGFNISAGVDSPVPGFTSSNGPNWVQFFGQSSLRPRIDIGMVALHKFLDGHRDPEKRAVQVFNLASGGATIDAALVAPFEPTVLSIVDQVRQFHEILAPKPAGAQWESSNSLFAFWIGINDVGNSFGWTNVTSQADFHRVLMKRLFSQVEILYQDGARSFLFLTVPPTNRAPLLIEQGPQAVAKITAALADYNAQLAENVRAFQTTHHDLDQVTVFDTRPIFNTLLDNAETFGFVNRTGFCNAYQNGTPEKTTQIAPCAPVSSYFWLNTLHPLFTVHNILAHAISTKQST
ncbi:Carbohydrate Esterase Family 16 protein [Trametes cinnabarina]|uniref:Carbohydrate Esterase Family 16 protein n=1 Tax=Pycnoporus cinnabarinus TaxID=5643 RepID=A0A060SHI5_PYCCI|nr:Carbohydrate Esterase Family 16 protein [Trametes cinnabarina]